MKGSFHQYMYRLCSRFVFIIFVIICATLVGVTNSARREAWPVDVCTERELQLYAAPARAGNVCTWLGISACHIYILGPLDSYLIKEVVMIDMLWANIYWERV